MLSITSIKQLAFAGIGLACFLGSASSAIGVTFEANFNFGAVAVGGSAERTLTVRNSSVKINAGFLYVDGPFWLVDTDGKEKQRITVQLGMLWGNQQKVKVRFKPMFPGRYETRVVYRYNDCTFDPCPPSSQPNVKDAGPFVGFVDYEPISPHLADVNGDGMVDWVQVKRTANEGCVGLATGDGNFTHWSNCSSSRGAANNYAHYFADVNGDGMVDWVQAKRTANEGCVGLALGDGNFTHWSNCSAFRGAIDHHAHYFADVNGDGMADWIQVNRFVNQGCVGLATGDGNFTHWSNCSAFRGAIDHHAHYFADVNGDGMADWIQVNRFVNQGCVGLATGDGNFTHWSNCSSSRGAVNNYEHYLP